MTNRMSFEERSALVLNFARVLYVNGQSTEQTRITARHLGDILGIRVRIQLRWGELQIESENCNSRLSMTTEAEPTNVNMFRVCRAMRALEELRAGRMAPADVGRAVSVISDAPPAPTWLFALAAAAGAVALAVIFGVQHLPAAILIFISAGTGAIVRRALAHLSGNPFLQPFCAALLAGIIGAVAVRLQLSSSLRLVAVCPCMVLVPGAPILNGALDLIRGHIHLGAARWLFAGIVIAAICTGLLLGLAVFHVSLPVDVAARTAPFWFDTLAAGVAVAAYSIFFSTPLEMLAWPIAIGMSAHALRWWTLGVLHSSAEMGALAACLMVGLILTPVARRLHMPFADVGFASVVSMIPGVFLFRMASGLVQVANGSPIKLQLLSAIIADGVTAGGIIVFMSFGLLIPTLVLNYFAARHQETTSHVHTQILNKHAGDRGL